MTLPIHFSIVRDYKMYCGTNRLDARVQNGTLRIGNTVCKDILRVVASDEDVDKAHRSFASLLSYANDELKHLTHMYGIAGPTISRNFYKDELVII
jgi:hypothetical protein